MIDIRDFWMKASLITPEDIRYSYRSSERHIYEYAKVLIENSVDAEVLVPDMKGKDAVERKDYAAIKREFRSVPRRTVKCRHYLLPFSYHLFVYSGLPRDSLVYFPYSVYDYIWNILRKPKGQRYIIAAYSMHLKNGHIVEGHQFLELLLNSFMRMVFSTKESKKNIYHHVITRTAERYLQSLGIPKQNIFYVPTYVDSYNYKIATNGSRQLKVLHIGGVNKDVGTMVDIINKLKEDGDYNNFDFYFIGDSQAKELLDLSKTDKNVHCMRGVVDMEKRRRFEDMDVIVVPAVETFSRILLEGMSAGLYVIAGSKNPAAYEVKALGAKIDIAEYGNAGAYLKYLRALQRLKAYRPRFHAGRVTNRKIAVENFDTKVVLKKMVKMFVKAGGDDQDS